MRLIEILVQKQWQDNNTLNDIIKSDLSNINFHGLVILLESLKGFQINLLQKAGWYRMYHIIISHLFWEQSYKSALIIWKKTPWYIYHTDNVDEDNKIRYDKIR